MKRTSTYRKRSRSRFHKGFKYTNKYKAKYVKQKVMPILRVPYEATPRQVKTKLTYTFEYEHTTSSTVFTRIRYRATSLYDPEYETSPVGPNGAYAGYSSMYDRYSKTLVNGSKLELWCTNLSSGSHGNLFIYPTEGTSDMTYSDTQDLYDSKIVRYLTFFGGDYAQKQPVYCKNYWQTRNYYPDLDSNLTADAGSNPGLNWYWNVVSDTTKDAVQAILWIKQRLTAYIIATGPITQVN